MKEEMKKEILYIAKSIGFIILLCFGLFLFLSLFASCKKEPITPGNYSAPKPPPEDTTTWVWQYGDSGVIPTWGGNQNNDLFGTTWVLTKVVSAFATSYPNDTIRFVSNTNYTLNNGAVRPYQLSSSAGSTNKTLALYYFAPFGGSHYSAQVGFYFVTDGFMNNAEFTNIQNTTATTRAWFVKL
jgi:hypothetical protein